MSRSGTVIAIIVAAGRGSRTGGFEPKQYRVLGGEPVLSRTLKVFLDHPAIDGVVTVIHPGDKILFDQALASVPENAHKLRETVHGAETRQGSVYAGLKSLTGGSRPDLVLVHDAARPFVDVGMIDRAIVAGRTYGAALPGVPVTDTVKRVDESDLVIETPRRSTLRAVQTPQVFHFDDILEAHEKAHACGLMDFTDDGALAEWAGMNVFVFEGDMNNIKLTHLQDFEQAERKASGVPTVYITRMGIGFDVHAFTEGDHVWLGGIRIPHDKGVLAHSDGDVVLHALTDALLGALAEGDIGVLFPPSDPQWKDASSDQFLAEAVRRVRARGGIVDHLDVTLLCEKPRLTPHREAMRQRIAEIADIDIDQVSIKATTTEKLGFTGRSEGIAAQSAATIRLPIH